MLVLVWVGKQFGLDQTPPRAWRLPSLKPHSLPRLGAMVLVEVLQSPELFLKLRQFDGVIEVAKVFFCSVWQEEQSQFQGLGAGVWYYADFVLYRLLTCV